LLDTALRACGNTRPGYGALVTLSAKFCAAMPPNFQQQSRMLTKSRLMLFFWFARNFSVV